MSLSGKICLVTGASRGLGKGIALQLGEAGATVYITGRSSSVSTEVVGGTLKETADEINSRGGKGVAVVCDHSKDDQVLAVFDRIKKDEGRLDVLVNNAYSAVNAIIMETQAGRKFWQPEKNPGEFWDVVNKVGLRNHYICSVYATQMMVERKRGLIVNISSFGGIRYLFNVAYGMGKCAVDRMSADMAIELKGTGVSCVTLYPGAVMTEIMSETSKTDARMKKMFSSAETTEFSGKAVVGLASDLKIEAKSGRICVCADLALEYGFKDLDGTQPVSYRQVNLALKMAGFSWLAWIIPDWVKIPGFLISASSSKF